VVKVKRNLLTGSHYTATEVFCSEPSCSPKSAAQTILCPQGCSSTERSPLVFANSSFFLSWARPNHFQCPPHKSRDWLNLLAVVLGNIHLEPIRTSLWTRGNAAGLIAVSPRSLRLDDAIFRHLGAIASYHLRRSLATLYIILVHP
jgi:hypothetical protein